MPLMRAPFRFLMVVVTLLALLAVTTATATPAAAAGAVARPDAAATSCSLVGTWTLSASWASGPLAGRSSTHKIVFRPDGSFSIDGQATQPGDRWTPTTLIDVHPTQPNEWLSATISVGGDCTRGTGALSYTGGWGDGSSGSHVLTRGWCATLSTVEQSFGGIWNNLPYPRLFTVQFTRLSVCWDGAYVWFKDTPEYRLTVDGNFTSTLVGACAGNARSAVDPNNANKLTSIFITCQAVFSNRQPATFFATPDGATGPGGDFTIPGFLNAGVAFPGGFVATPPPADQYRYYTIQILSNGCYTVSGVANTTVRCL